ncbi:MAG: ABC transporter permease [Bacteriovoracia bacterium]
MDRRLLLISPYIVWLVGLVLGPFLLILATSFALRDESGALQFGFHLDAYQQLADPLYLEVLGRTALLALAHSLLTIAAAYPMAFFLSRLDRSRAGTYLTLLLVPFWTNYLIRLLGFMEVLRWRAFGLEWTFTSKGMLAALLYNYLPFAVLPLYSALEKIPTSLIEAAQDLGASKRRVLTQVLWPLTRRPLIIVFLLVFIPALGEFLIPAIVGGGRSFYLGTFLEQQFLVSRNWPLGAAAIAVLLVLSATILVFAGKSLAEEEAA